MNDIDFHAWIRSSIYDLTTHSAADPRARGAIALTLNNTIDPTESAATRNAPFKVVGPPDVEGLLPGAVRRTQPSPNTDANEATKLAMVEFAAEDLPWRYSPESATGAESRVLRPWLVLVVGEDGDEPEIVEGRDTVTLSSPVIAAHPLSEAATWAHVQEGAPRVARLLSPRRLAADTTYLAVVVPTFAASGGPSWADGAASATVPAYYRWRFETGPAGDFATLAAQLDAGLSDATLGRADVSYERIQPAVNLSVRGALAPIGGVDAPLPAPVAADVAALRAPLQDDRGRDVITLPNYGEEWRTLAEATWSGEVNGDPRHRGAAGIGLKAGIVLQDEIARAAREQVGALGVAAQRIRSLASGIGAARSLWTRRLPSDRAHRIALFWPTTARLTSEVGTVRDAITAADRPLPPSLFSSGARRVLRRGPARSRLARLGASNPSRVLNRANRCPAPADDVIDGLPHVDLAAKQLNHNPISEELADAAKRGELPFDRLREMAERFLEELKRAGYDEGVIRALRRCLDIAFERRDVERIADLIAPLKSLDPHDPEPLLSRIEGCDDGGPDDLDDLIEVIQVILERPPARPCRPIDIDRLHDVLVGAIDPTSPTAPAIVRVLDTITGLSPPLLAPPEPCIGLDLPAWRYLRDHDPEWLLPGVGNLEMHTVVAVETNATFVDSFLLGLNRQTLHEMRWRNISTATHCTPLRVFWDRVNPAANNRVDDIIGVRDWQTNSAIGAPQHRPVGVAGTNLVLVFRTHLFRRYPSTIVSLASAVVNGDPDWDAEPNLGSGRRISPDFQGKIGDDIVFFGFDVAPADARDHWVVLEEPPPGIRFRHPERFPTDPPDMSGVVDGATYADKTFNDPTLVLIRGDKLIPRMS